MNAIVKTQKSTKYFSVPIEKENAKTDNDGNQSIATVFYKIKYIDSAKFMAKSLSNLLDNLAEEIHKTKCKDCVVSFSMKALMVM